MFFQKQIFVFVAQRHHLGHIDLIVGCEHCCGILAVFEAPRNCLAQTCHLHAFFTGGIFDGDGGARR